MANSTRTSVAKTSKGYGSAVSASTVTSTTEGVYRAYNGPTLPGMAEGQSPVNTYGPGTAPPTTSDVTSITAATAGTTAGYTSATAVVCSTTASTGTGTGLIVSFTTSASGVASGTPGDYTIVDAGTGYATGNTVSIDGFPGSSLTVSIA